MDNLLDLHLQISTDELTTLREALVNRINWIGLNERVAQVRNEQLSDFLVAERERAHKLLELLPDYAEGSG